MPQDLNQVLYTLQCYAILVHTLFQGPGATNTFAESMWHLSNTFNNCLPLYLGEHQKLQGTVWYDVFPVHIIHYGKICVHKYLHELQLSTGGDQPQTQKFMELHQSLQQGSFHTSVEWLPLPMSVTVDTTRRQPALSHLREQRQLHRATHWHPRHQVRHP